MDEEDDCAIIVKQILEETMKAVIPRVQDK